MTACAADNCTFTTNSATWCSVARRNLDALIVRLHVKDAGFYRQVAGNGSVGAGEAYMDGQWSCDDLVALMRLLVRNRDLLDGMETGVARLGGYAMKALHAFRRNTRLGSRKNIAAHYDLGNDFFKTVPRRGHDVFLGHLRRAGRKPGARLPTQARSHLRKSST